MTSRTGNLILLAGLLGVVTACRTQHTYLEQLPPTPVEDKPVELQAGYRALNSEGSRNYVVNQMEIGLDARQLGHSELSVTAFDAALNAIETVFGEDTNAKKARRLWNEEGRKTFKGEPYERAMAYYYRGLLYIEAGDLENARACFRAGMFQDAFVEEEQNQQDFALFLYLEAWCSLMLDDRVGATDAIRFLGELRPDCPAPSNEANVLVIGETGAGPRKLATGPGESELVYARGTGSQEKRVRVEAEANEAVVLYPIEDIYWQASTRGGRPVDRILRGKAVFKENWDAAGSVLTNTGVAGLVVGSGMRGKQRDAAMAISGGVALLGVLSHAVAGAVQPRADTRRFRNLPDTVHVTVLQRAPGVHTLRFRFLDDANTIVKSTRRQVTVPSRAKGACLVWAHTPILLVAGK